MSAPTPTSPPPPIPVPPDERWFDLRVRFLPALVFIAALGCAAMLWRADVLGAPVSIGQAEPVISDVSCHKTGVLSELDVVRFQRVKTGDRIGQVMIVDAQVMTNSIAVIRAEIEMLRATVAPTSARQRIALEYDKYRLDWLKERTDLASARAELQYAEGEFRRMESLFKEKPPIVSERQYEQAKEQRDRRLEQVNELSKAVTNARRNSRNFSLQIPWTSPGSPLTR